MKREMCSGFSLLELMIVIAIIGVLASLTVPSYQQSVKQSRRVDAISGLLELQLSQAKAFAEEGKYKTSLTEMGGNKDVYTNNYYQLKFIHANTLQWLVIATPVGNQSGDVCGVFAMNENGPVYGGKYASQDCWN